MARSYNANYVTKLDNCVNKATIRGNDIVGGIVGHIYTNYNVNVLVTNCTNDGNVIGSNNVGGIAGQIAYGSNISSCSNTGSISGDSNIGGIVGYCTSTPDSIEMNCTCSGIVTEGGIKVNKYVGYSTPTGGSSGGSN